MTPFESSKYEIKVGRFSSHSQILQLAGNGRGKTALDFGCFDGKLAALLVNQGWVVDGIDRDQEALANAASVCRSVMDIDVESANPSDFGSYDLLVFADILEHTTSPLDILQTWVKAMDNRTQVIVSMPNIAHAFVRLSLLLGRFNYQDRGILDRTHLRFFTHQTFITLLQLANLEIKELRVTPTPIELVLPSLTTSRLWPTIDTLNATLASGAKRILGYQFVALAQPKHV